jgi:hypothetical protein
MADLSCLPPCVVNAAEPLPGQILVVGSTTSTVITLCDPTTDVPVVVSLSVQDGVLTSSAFNLDGTPYPGAVEDLVQCTAPAPTP